jgi:Phosphotransferase enzyme family
VTDGTSPGERWLAGNVGGAVLVGDTVRRPTGPWTPAVHALLDHLASRVPHVPRVLGFDERGRESLSYLPGRVVDIDTELLTDAQIASVVGWTRTFHAAVAGFAHPGPWRYFPLPSPTLIGHNDIAPYNVCFDGDELTGVFDWDLAGPTTPLLELAFIAWNCVPLWRDTGHREAARRLDVIASGYGGFSARQVLHAVPPRIEAMLDGIPRAAAAGDQGMANLVARGEPERSRASLTALLARIPAIDRYLA